MGIRYERQHIKTVSITLPPELNSLVGELADLAGISREAVMRHLILMGAPGFRATIDRGALPPDPLVVYRDQVLARALGNR